MNREYKSTIKIPAHVPNLITGSQKNYDDCFRLHGTVRRIIMIARIARRIMTVRRATRRIMRIVLDCLCKKIF